MAQEEFLALKVNRWIVGLPLTLSYGAKPVVMHGFLFVPLGVIGKTAFWMGGKGLGLKPETGPVLPNLLY